MKEANLYHDDPLAKTEKASYFGFLSGWEFRQVSCSCVDNCNLEIKNLYSYMVDTRS